ncbi:MAG: hypothetical protein ACRD68_12680, partial [Pyrinomonadaceae bacterium]
TCGTPVVAVTAHYGNVHRDLARGAGCNEFVVKPIDFNQLEKLIVDLLRERRPKEKQKGSEQAA